MKKTLLIVESAAKCKTISSMLGPGFSVVACFGHLKNLPRNRLGIDVSQNFLPEFEVLPGKNEHIEKLRLQTENARHVIIATDPDREGEAIAGHLIDLLKLKRNQYSRIRFNEISPNAILTAMSHRSEINDRIIASQNARRVIDRLWGFQMSPVLGKNICRGTSTGRVQSAVISLIAEREHQRTIQKHRLQWGITAHLIYHGKRLGQAPLCESGNNPITFKSQEEAIRFCDKIPDYTQFPPIVKTTACKSSFKKPFTTTAFLQAVAHKTGFTARKAMRIAQELYNGIKLQNRAHTGLITYIRTDSSRISADAAAKLDQFIYQKTGVRPEMPGDQPENAGIKIQDAHEALRPVNFHLTPDSISNFLTPDQSAIYQLIWQNSLISRMPQQTGTHTIIDFPIENNLKWRLHYESSQFHQKISKFLPDDPTKLLKKSVEYTADIIFKNFRLHDYAPPCLQRYSEAGLLADLDKNNIGRPSTLASIVPQMRRRGYIQLSGSQLKPTPLGLAVHKSLKASCGPGFNTRFTSRMEQQLAKIEQGEEQYLAVVEKFYRELQAVLAKFKPVEPDAEKEEVSRCPRCGQKLFERTLHNQKFLACSGYPDCRYSIELKTCADQIIMQ